MIVARTIGDVNLLECFSVSLSFLYYGKDVKPLAICKGPARHVVLDILSVQFFSQNLCYFHKFVQYRYVSYIRWDLNIGYIIHRVKTTSIFAYAHLVSRVLSSFQLAIISFVFRGIISTFVITVPAKECVGCWRGFVVLGGGGE